MEEAIDLLHSLQQLGLTVATAESCTGGHIAGCLTEVPGASAVVLGGVVSYANKVKERLLGVASYDLEEYGAVSRQVVEQMAAGACRIIGSDCSMATSGIAGPGGATPGKPVGTVWTAWCVKGSVTSELCHFNGDRLAVIEQATRHAISTLNKILTKPLIS